MKVSNPNCEPSHLRPTGSSFPRPPSLDAPEGKLTFFAMCLAIIEKAEYEIGKLAFFWACVVFRSYASTLKPIEFWFVAGVFLVQGTRIFSRSFELDWQYQSTHTLLATSSHPLPDYMLQLDEQKTWLPKDVQLLLHCIFVLKNISYLLHRLQILAAVVCVAISLMRLGQQDFGEEAQNNQKSVLIIFYILALAEALIFLLKKSYWTWTVVHRELFMRVMEELEFGPNGVVPLRLFFYDVYSKCMGGNCFDGLKMDLISFAEKLLDANSLNNQIIGAEILKHFVNNKRFAVGTLRKIRLIEMLNRKSLNDAERDPNNANCD